MKPLPVEAASISFARASREVPVKSFRMRSYSACDSARLPVFARAAEHFGTIDFLVLFDLEDLPDGAIASAIRGEAGL